ncbi:hypothetical protein MAR_025541, partial [Mya arenaria]
MKTITPRQAYTILSKVTSRKVLLLKNFSQNCIVVNKAAVDEIEIMRADSLFSWTHPLSVLTENDFIVSISCLCETHVKNIVPFAIEGFHLLGKDIEHGLAVYIKHGVLSTRNEIQVMARTFFLTHGRLNLLLTYKQPNLGSTIFFNQSLKEIEAFDSCTSTIVIGEDFNINVDHSRFPSRYPSVHSRSESNDRPRINKLGDKLWRCCLVLYRPPLDCAAT